MSNAEPSSVDEEPPRSRPCPPTVTLAPNIFAWLLVCMPWQCMIDAPRYLSARGLSSRYLRRSAWTLRTTSAVNMQAEHFAAAVCRAPSGHVSTAESWQRVGGQEPGQDSATSSFSACQEHERLCDMALEAVLLLALRYGPPLVRLSRTREASVPLGTYQHSRCILAAYPCCGRRARRLQTELP